MSDSPARSAAIGERLLAHAAASLLMLVTTPATAATADPTRPNLDLTLTWGHRSPSLRSFVIRVAGHDLAVDMPRLVSAEVADTLADDTARTRAGGGDVDGLSCTLVFPSRTITPITNAHSLWRHLWEHGDPDATRRLQSDPAFRPDSRRLEVTLDDDGRSGFSLTVDQLLRQRAFWFPELDLFVSTGTTGISLADHLAVLGPRQGRRVLDRVGREPEATYGQFTNRWEDMGSPSYTNPHSVPPGQIIGLAWPGALFKFGVDRTAAVRNDYGKADEFQLGFDFGAAPDPSSARTGQHLTDGLPCIVTTFAKDGVGCVVEQFAFPVDGPAAGARGEAPMVLLQKVRLTGHATEARDVPFRLALRRGRSGTVTGMDTPGGPSHYALVDDDQRTLLVLEGTQLPAPLLESRDSGPAPLHRLRLPIHLPPGRTFEFVVKLPSPALGRSAADIGEHGKLLALEFDAARTAALAFWNDQLDQGARFQVPEAAVNTLFRANLWHARRLPRRHRQPNGPDRLDLPYSNFAYDQQGTPWPVNQAVYVDYMLYDLRGHHALAEEELAAIYRTNQEPNGHVGGFANWGVYTPGMLYAVGQHFLLSGDRAAFERLLPPSLRALDWCLNERRRADAAGLIHAPLNDLSHDALPWAFNQAYFVGGLATFGRALARLEHPRAAECVAAAVALRAAVERNFAQATRRSPAVELADGTWIPYVPSHALASGRHFTLWYPTDVDTGSLHLPRLGALDPTGPLTTFLLHDHEDNLLFRQWGAINEPVYNMQGTVYLRRDEPEAAIRTFYGTMACAFGHSTFEPVEHRWGWGQYFGPPSTDGAWFELYRNLLVRELDDDTLFLGQATPRAWLEDGRGIEVRRAPTYFGPLDLRIASEANAGHLRATVELAGTPRPAALVVRLRHPRRQPIRSVIVNGAPWDDFDPAREWVRIAAPRATRYEITTTY